MEFSSYSKTFHHNATRVHLKRRTFTLAVWFWPMSMTFPVIAVGMDTYTVTDGTNTDTVVLHESDAETTAPSVSSFDAGEYSITPSRGRERLHRLRQGKVRCHGNRRRQDQDHSYRRRTCFRSAASGWRRSRRERHRGAGTGYRALTKATARIKVTRVTTKTTTETKKERHCVSNRDP